jgi:ribosome biogenesis protein Tsr3
MNTLLKLFSFRDNKRGVSNAISTLMILTASVALTGAVVLVVTNVSTNAMTSEKLIVPSAHVWYINSTSSVGGIILTNSGTTDSIINKITINGIDCSWNNGNNSFVIYSKTESSFGGDLSF